MGTRRFLIAVDVDEDELDRGDCTFDDVREGFAARLGAFYPSNDGSETAAELVACAEVTESLDFVLAALEVGLEGADPDRWTARVLDDAWVAHQRFTGDLEAYVSPQARAARGIRNDGNCTKPCEGVGVLHPYHGVGQAPQMGGR